MRSVLRKHHSVSLIYDETGPVLVSHPTKFSRGNNQQQPQQQSEGCNETYDSAVIQLLHLHDLYTKEGIRTVSLYPKVKDDDGKISKRIDISALYCDPFIFRNRLYLFNRFGDNLLCVSIAGSDRSEVRILNTYPDVKGERPSSRYANRCHILLNETLLVYYHQRLDKPDAQPQLWKLELGPLHWNRLQLLLSHHFPIGRVSLRQCSSGAFAFLHGECGRSICQEKAHLYQFSLIQQSLMVSLFVLINYLVGL
ncbi:unnamed protein product [Anisakis simplex]|uniref:Sema domain-containing protein n=1 Tax=Anisakis simplex TaxID=6269 RepID=A0A0M3JR51_ANISI|nr:unnamed protein product [Anisakis simplex]